MWLVEVAGWLRGVIASGDLLLWVVRGARVVVRYAEIMSIATKAS